MDSRPHTDPLAASAIAWRIVVLHVPFWPTITVHIRGLSPRTKEIV
jgi:hypothetical protein